MVPADTPVAARKLAPVMATRHPVLFVLLTPALLSDNRVRVSALLKPFVYFVVKKKSPGRQVRGRELACASAYFIFHLSSFIIQMKASTVSLTIGFALPLPLTASSLRGTTTSSPILTHFLPGSTAMQT